MQTIEKLESGSLTKEAQWRIVQEAGTALTGSARQAFEAGLNSNPDVAKFATNDNPQFRLETMYAPLVSVDVGRSLAQQNKSMLADRRQNLTFENVEMLSIIMYNKFLA